MAVDEKSTEKSRRERRKEARLGKNKQKFDSWVQHQQSQKAIKKSLIAKSKDAKRLHNDNQVQKRKEVELMNSDDEGELEQSLEQDFTMEDSVIESNDTRRKKGSVKNSKIKLKEASGKKRKKSKIENEELDDEEMDDNNDGEFGTLDASSKKHGKKDPKKSKMVKQKKTKFEEYMETEMQSGVMSAAEDLALERRLAKKLKVKEGKLRSDDLDLNWLIEGLPTFDELVDKKAKTDEVPPKKREKIHSRKKHKQKDSSEQEQVQEQEQEQVQELEQEKVSGDSSAGVSEATETSGADVAKVKAPSVEPASGGKTKYVAPHMRSRMGNESDEYAQIRRRIRGLLNRMSESNVESITAEISTIFRSMGRSIGSQVIGEEVVTSCSGGPRGNDQYAAVFSAFVAGMACSVGIDFGAKLLASLARCFEDEYVKEDNLSLRNLTLLLSYLYTFGVCSSELVYDFLMMLSKRLTEVDVSTILTVLQACGMKLRGDDPVGMKNFILNVQSRVNELKTSSGEGESDISGKRMEFMLETICNIKNNKARPKEDSVQQTRIKKWLQKLRVNDILIRGLKWSKLLDPDKKGQWWLSGDIASNVDNVEEVASTIDKEVLEAQKLLQLAAAQRMNTDARKAIFCIIMSGEDYIDAFEKLLRLDLPGKQDREIMRVLVECCLQEKAFNKYYCVLATKLCSHDKNHKFTLQYCLWDHYKELESMPLVRSMHLAKFVAEMVTSFSISISVLKAVDLSDTAQLTPQRIMHFRMLFEALFERPDKIIWNVFTRIAVTPEYESLRSGIELFASKYVVGFEKSLAGKLKIAKKALNNLQGILM